MPTDPNNGASSGKCNAWGVTSTVCYYAYGCSGTNYEIDAIMESTKYASSGAADVTSKDGGNEPAVYEIGNKLDL